MKQTTILPFYQATTPKKSPLPILSKSIAKSPYTKSPPQYTIPTSVTLSPATKRNLNPREDPQQPQLTPLLPLNRISKRRSRDSFEGVTQSYHKKFKPNSDPISEEEELITIRLTSKTQDYGHEKAFPQKDNTPKLCNSSTMDQSFASPKEQEETKNSYELLSTSSPNYVLEFNNTFGEETGVSQVMKHLSSSKKSSIDKENISKASSKNSSPIKESLASPQKSQLSAETLSLLSKLKASNISKEINKMVEEKPEEKPVSSATLDLIKSLKNKEALAEKSQKSLSEQLFEAKPRDQVASILKGPSIREKYEELLNKEREFILPVQYKKLLSVFDCIDKSMNYFLTRREPTFFSGLIKAVEETLKIRIDSTQLAQIAHVMPSAYTIAWEKNDRMRGELDLHLKFPNNENGTEGNFKRVLTLAQLEERKGIFKDCLVRITRGHHNEFLKTLSEVEREKNYDELRCWNSKFKVHECVHIPEGKLPEKPHRENLKSMKDFLISSETKNTRITRIMEEIVKENEKKAVVAEVAPVVKPKNVQGISEKLLAKIREKELAIAKEAAQRSQIHTAEKYTRMQQELKKVAEILRVYYTQRKVSSMFFANVVEHLVKNSQNLVLGSNEASKYLEELIKLCPEWLSIHKMDNTHNILKMDKNVDMKLVYDKITTAN